MSYYNFDVMWNLRVGLSNTFNHMMETDKWFKPLNPYSVYVTLTISGNTKSF